MALAKHSSSSNEDKQTTTITDESNHLSNEPKSDSTGDSTTAIPIAESTVGNVVIPLQQGDTVTVTACSDGSNHNSDAICVNPADKVSAETNQQEQTFSQPQSTPTPQVNPITDTEISENPTSTTIDQQNQAVIDNLIAAGQNQDTSGSSGSGGSSTSSDNQDSTSDEQKNIFAENQDKNLGAETHFVIMSQDNGVGLYHIVSDETDLDTGILPQTIRLVQTFQSTGEAMSWLQEYDSRSQQ